jgi:histidine phosphotransferase ChpT
MTATDSAEAVDHRTETMTTTASLAALQPLDLAAMLCSKVCHDVISPVGAIVNGLEVLEDDSDPSMRDVAIDLIKRSAAGASAKLQFCRLAFGAAGSAGASIDTGDAEKVARALLETEKTKLEWSAPRQFFPKNKVKLLLNLCQIANATSPRGGVIEVALIGEGESAGLRVAIKGANPRLQPHFAELLAGDLTEAKVDAHSIQPYFAGLVARECGLAVKVEPAPEGLAFLAEPVPAAPAEAPVAVPAEGV